MTHKLANCIKGFRKKHGTQHSLIMMLEKWKRAIDKEDCVLTLRISQKALIL